MKNAIVLLSGGLDSATCLALATSQGFNCYALSFNYHQRHSVEELNAAKKIAKKFNAKHHIFDLNIHQFGNSALTDYKIDVPDYDAMNQNIPVTYVPARNTIFLAIALGFAEVNSAKDIFIGVSAIDYSHYPDCRPEFIAAFQNIALLATKAGVEGKDIKLHAPLLHLSKAQTIQLGLSLGVDYKDTISCYQADAGGLACGTCDSCQLRIKGFKEAQVADVTAYRDL